MKKNIINKLIDSKSLELDDIYEVSLDDSNPFEDMQISDNNSFLDIQVPEDSPFVPKCSIKDIKKGWDYQDLYLTYGYRSMKEMAFHEAFEGDIDAWEHYNQ